MFDIINNKFICSYFSYAQQTDYQKKMNDGDGDAFSFFYLFLDTHCLIFVLFF